jgi:hypothetical protein
MRGRTFPFEKAEEKLNVSHCRLMYLMAPMKAMPLASFADIGPGDQQNNRQFFDSTKSVCQPTFFVQLHLTRNANLDEPWNFLDNCLSLDSSRR